MTNYLPKTLPPVFLLLFAILALLIEAFAVYTLHQQPWTGIRTATVADNPQILEIVALDTGSPAAEHFQLPDHHHNPENHTTLPPYYLVALEQAGQAIPLNQDMRAEPLGIADFVGYTNYLQLQQNLYTLLSNGKPVDFVMYSGERITLTPAQNTPLQAIPTVFWLLFPVNLAGLIIGAWVWMRQPRQLAAIQLCIAGLSYFGLGTCFSLLLVRELALPANLISWLTTGQATLLNIFCLALAIIITTFPKPLLPRYGLWLMGLVMLLLSLNFHFQWLEFPWHKYIFPYLFIYLFGVWGLYLQWVNARGQPLDRAAILALQLSAVIPCGLIVVLFAVPKIMGAEPLLGIVSTRLILLAIFVGWGVGILRYRLFDVEYWWLKSLFWVIGGCLVFLVDVAAVSLFHASEQYALGLAVIVAGFLYFPLRQWVLQKMLPAESRSLQDFLPLFSSQMTGAKTQLEFEQYWRNALQQRFQPLHLEPLNQVLSAPTIAESGMSLQVPDLQGQQSYQLHGKQRAARLFNKADVKNTESYLPLLKWLAMPVMPANKPLLRSANALCMTCMIPLVLS